MRPHPLRRSAALLAFALLLPSRLPAVVTSTFTPGGEGGRGTITARASANVTVTVKDSAGTVVATGNSGATGVFAYVVPANAPKGKYTVTTSDGCSDNSTVAFLNPPQNAIFTTDQVLAGSQATAAGQTFALTGSFTAADTSIDYNPASPTYGNVGGLVLAPAFNLHGTGPAGTLSLALNGNEPYHVNLRSVWTAPDFRNTSISFTSTMAGTATLNNMTGPFSGQIAGMVTFLDGGQQSVNFALQLETMMGTITGNVSASGAERLFLAGDADQNGVVAFADLLTLAQHYGTLSGATWQMGDFNFDGKVDFSDLLLLAQNYGQGTPLASGTDVPEPTTLALGPVLTCLLAAALSAFRKNRRLTGAPPSSNIRVRQYRVVNSQQLARRSGNFGA